MPNPAGLGRTIPALPVRDMARALAHYCDVLGFNPLHESEDLAVLRRDDAVLHLWVASDDEWRSRGAALAERPVCSGAESFLAGTASCRIETEDVDALFTELRDTGVLHSINPDAVRTTDFGTREVCTVDPDGNMVEFFHWQ